MQKFEIDTSLGQLAVELLRIKREFRPSDKFQREAIMDAIDLLDKLMDRLQVAH